MGVVLLGLVLRLVVIAAKQGGLGANVNPGFDESVYVGAAWLLRQGSLPYRDFVFVFPPGYLVVLWPVAQLASHFGGPALTVTLVRVLAAFVGALNIWLVGRIGARWLGGVGGVVAAVIYATTPVVVQTDAAALQEPFVNLGVLLAVIVWAERPDRERSVGRLVAAGLLVGAAISMKLVSGVFLVPLLIAGPFVRPLADRVRLVVVATLPLLLTGTVFAALVGLRPVFEQAVLAQVFRPRGGEGLSRVDSLLPVLRGQVRFTTFLAGANAWIAVVIFAVACVAAVWKGGPPGRLWGSSGLMLMVVLMASPSYYAHYGVLLAPAASLVAAFVLTGAVAALRDRRVVSTAVATVVLGLLVVAIGATQISTTVEALPVGLGELPDHLGRLVEDRGRPAAGRVSIAIQRTPAGACIVAVRPQPLLDANRVPSADRHGHVLLDVYGSSLLAARNEARQPSALPGAYAFPTVQADIVRQSRDCERIVFARHNCRQGRRDITAATQKRLEAGTRLVATDRCTVLRRRATSQ